MKKITFLPIFVLVSLLFACEKEVTDVKLPTGTRKLVVTSFISPQDTLIWVKVGQTTPVFGMQTQPEYYLSGLTVSLSDGNQEVLLPRRNSKSDTFAVYRDQFPILSGQTYFLKVTAADGRQAEARCTVPQPYPFVPEIKLDTTSEGDGQYARIQARLIWQDIAGETNYYRIAGELKSEEIFRNPNFPDSPTGKRVSWRPVYWDGQETNYYISDAKLDGTRLDSPKGNIGTVNNSQPLPGQPQPKLTLYAYLLHTDRHYYEYHRSVYRSLYAQDNPFAEPALVYSNVTGGLGVFAAYNKTIAEMEL